MKHQPGAPALVPPRSTNLKGRYPGATTREENYQAPQTIVNAIVVCTAPQGRHKAWCGPILLKAHSAADTTPHASACQKLYLDIDRLV